MASAGSAPAMQPVTGKFSFYKKVPEDTGAPSDPTACFVMTFGGLIEQVTSESARKAIKSLIQISPQTATVLTGGKEKILPEDLIDRHAT